MNDLNEKYGAMLSRPDAIYKNAPAEETESFYSTLFLIMLSDAKAAKGRLGQKWSQRMPSRNGTKGASGATFRILR